MLGYKEVQEDYQVSMQVDHNTTTKRIMNDNNSIWSNSNHSISVQKDNTMQTVMPC